MSSAFVALLIAAGAWGSGRQAPAPATSPDPAVQVHGEFALLADVLPRRKAAEMRPRVVIEATTAPRRGVRGHVEVMAEGLAANRGGQATAARADVRDAWLEAAGARAEIRAGYGRLVWGRLDELQPTDVINPIDAARFLLQGRSDARMAVAFVRARAFSAERWTIEGVLAPVFRRGTLDALEEGTSPFNLVNDAVLPTGVAVPDRRVEQITPTFAWRHVSGGARVQRTFGRTDVSGMAYRGFDGIGPISLETSLVPAVSPIDPSAPLVPTVVGRLVEAHPRFTMLGGDLETVTGPWAIRGEVAVRTEQSFAASSRPGLVAGHSIDAGAGVDRRVGAYRVFAAVVWHRQWSPADAAITTTDTTLVGSIERSFRRDRLTARAFGVLNPGDASGFVRGVATLSIRDDVAIDVSAAAFLGTGSDTISRFSGRDFLLARLRYRF